MKTVRIGARRLYDSMGCSLFNQQSFNLVFPFADCLQMEIYIGNKPKFGIAIETEHDEYIIPGEQSRIGRYDYHADATQSSYPRNFFTELICSLEEGVSDELFTAFYENDQQANLELLRRAEAHKDDFKVAMDFICGVLGLRFHPQFIQELLNENFVAFHNEQRTYNGASSSMQLLERVQLNQTGIDMKSV